MPDFAWIFVLPQFFFSCLLLAIVENGQTTLFFTRGISNGNNPINSNKNILIGSYSNVQSLVPHVARSTATV
jgi:hypothetical protein